MCECVCVFGGEGGGREGEGQTVSLYNAYWCLWHTMRLTSFRHYYCEQVLFVYVSTLIPPCLTDQRNFFTVLLVTREPEQTTLLF